MPNQDNSSGHEVWGRVQSGCHGVRWRNERTQTPLGVSDFSSEQWGSTMISALLSQRQSGSSQMSGRARHWNLANLRFCVKEGYPHQSTWSIYCSHTPGQHQWLDTSASKESTSLSGLYTQGGSQYSTGILRTPAGVRAGGRGRGILRPKS